MSQSVRTAALSILLPMLLLVGNADAAPDPKKKPAKPTKVPYAVILIGGTELEVLPAKELKAKQKAMVKEYKESYKAWKQAKKDARKAKQKFREPKPKKPSLKVLKTFPTQDQANAYVEKLKKEAEKKKNKGKGNSKKKK